MSAVMQYRKPGPGQWLAYATLVMSIVLAGLTSHWLSQENPIERDNRIEMHINQHLMFGRGSEAYALLREELAQGAELLPQWVNLLRFEPDSQTRFSLLTAQLERSPNREDLYRAIYRQLTDTRNPLSEAEKSRWLVELNQQAGLNADLMQRYGLRIN